MQYALIDGEGRLHALEELGDDSTWSYPEGFEIVEAEGFEPDPSYEFADYVYVDGGFALEPQEVETIDALIMRKVDAALLREETRVQAISAGKVSDAPAGRL